MYHQLSRGSVSKITGKATRRGSAVHSQLDTRVEQNQTSNGSKEETVFGPLGEMSHYPKPVFNGKRNYGRPQQNYSSPNPEPVSQGHEECIKYLSDTWNRIQHEYENGIRQERICAVQWYQEKSSPTREGFEPFNLHEWASHRRAFNHSTHTT